MMERQEVTVTAAVGDGIIVSVVICTSGRREQLEHALESLANQSWQHEGWEVIVVENSPDASPAVAEVVGTFSSWFSLRHFLETTPNLSRARNVGAAKASGIFVAYLDDDAVAAPSWLEAIVDGTKAYAPDFCGGPVSPLFRVPKPEWFREATELGYQYGDRPRLLTKAETIGGMNFIVRRELVLSSGGFREDLAMAGTKIVYGDDTAFLKDAWNKNPALKVQYLPNAKVWHEVRPEKMTLRWQIQSRIAHSRDVAIMNDGDESICRILTNFTRSVIRSGLKGPVLALLLLRDLVCRESTLSTSYFIYKFLPCVGGICNSLYACLIKIRRLNGRDTQRI